jgi:hypothetical protein
MTDLLVQISLLAEESGQNLLPCRSPNTDYPPETPIVPSVYFMFCSVLVEWQVDCHIHASLPLPSVQWPHITSCMVITIDSVLR